MPRSSDPNDLTYGPEYRTLLRAAWTHIQTSSPVFTFPLQTKLQAMIMRKKMYAYFNAVRVAAKAGDKDAKKLTEIIREIMLKTNDVCLEFSRKRDAWDNVLIRQALGLSDDWDRLPDTGGAGPGTFQPPPPLTPSGESPMDALTRIRARSVAAYEASGRWPKYPLQDLEIDYDYPSNSD